MAARHLQKLRTTQAPQQEAEDSDTSEDAVPSRKVAPFNPFDLLSDEEVPPLPSVNATKLMWPQKVLCNHQ